MATRSGKGKQLSGSAVLCVGLVADGLAMVRVEVVAWAADGPTRARSGHAPRSGGDRVGWSARRPLPLRTTSAGRARRGDATTEWAASQQQRGASCGAASKSRALGGKRGQYVGVCSVDSSACLPFPSEEFVFSLLQVRKWPGSRLAALW
jgi:hypothetical protein